MAEYGVADRESADADLECILVVFHLDHLKFVLSDATMKTAIETQRNKKANKQIRKNNNISIKLA